MKCFGVICCWMITCIVQAQVWHSNITVSKVYLPDSVTHSSDAFAQHLLQNYKTKQEQLKTAYVWITSNIRYDKDSSYHFNWGVDHEIKVNATLRRRKGVCENFASLFSDIANRMNIPSYVVHGYAAGIGDRDAAHSWSAVQLEDEWYLCDPTWDAGLQNGYQYFLADPLMFAQTHIPFDPIWQLLDHPQGYHQLNGKRVPVFKFKDSIRVFLAADSLQQFLAIERRMKEMGKNKEMFRLWQAYNRMHIAIIAGENDMQLYNSAVEDVNMATDVLNEYIQYRNNSFLPLKNDRALAVMLDPVESYIKTSRIKIDSIGLLVANFQYDTEGLKKRINALEQKCREQMLFLKKYLVANPAEREQMMYR